MRQLKPNLFDQGMLDRFCDSVDYASLLVSGDLAGPWVVRWDGEDGWTVHLACGGRPIVVTRFHELACMLAATLPLVATESVFVLRKDGDLQTRYKGRELESVARLGENDCRIPPVLDIAYGILTRPESLAWFLMAAPAETLEQAGAIVAKRLGK